MNMAGSNKALGHFGEVALLLVSVLISYSIAEAAYRAVQYVTLPGRIAALGQATIASAGGEYAFDADVGYRYGPNQDVTFAAPWNSHWRTNSHGHVASDDYPTAKPRDEFRIAVIGDSFTANIVNNVRWTETLERELNASAEWRSAIADKPTRVINFGVDGFGLTQFAAMLHYQAIGYEPDIVIVNFISDDVWRRLSYRRNPATEPERRRYIRDRFLNRVDWLGVCPELLAAVAGRFIGLQCTMPLFAVDYVATDDGLRYGSRDEAIEAAASAVSSIRADAPGAIFLRAWLRYELDPPPPDELKGIVEDLVAAAPEMRPISMKRAVPDGPLDPAFLVDGHYGDAMTEIYGRAVASELIARFSRATSSAVER